VTDDGIRTIIDRCTKNYPRRIGWGVELSWEWQSVFPSSAYIYGKSRNKPWWSRLGRFINTDDAPGYVADYTTV